ncbi:MAG: TolC family protein [Chitinophagaceae bacterium]
MKNRKVTAVLLALAFLVAIITPSAAQNKMPLTLQAAIDLSIKNSPRLKNSSAKVEEASAAIKEAEDRRLPDISGSGAYLRLNKPNVAIKTKTTQPAPGGTPSGETANPSKAAYGMVNASLPLYSGLRIRYGIEAAKYLEQALKLDAANDKEGVILNTIDAYNNLYKSKAAATLVKQSLEEAKQRVKELANLEKNGLLARNDLLKAQLQTSNTELALLDAENNWQLSNINMTLMLGLPETTEIIPDSSTLVPGTDVKNAADYLQIALQNRKDLSAFSYRKKATAVEVKSIAAEKYPSLALTGGYVAIDVPKVLTVTNAVNLGIGIQYNLASLWKLKARVQEAKAREKQVAANEDMLTNAIRLQVNQAYLNYLLSRKKIAVQAEAVAQAEDNYNVINNKYKNGLATVTDLLDADIVQLQARMNYSFSKSDAAVAYQKLLQSAGIVNQQ